MSLASTLRFALLLLLLQGSAAAQAIRVNPVGVNVNSSGATTVFLTFGGAAGYRAAEAVWCGELIPAAPDRGMKCDPGTVFGSLPSRFDLSARSGAGAFTDIMSIPPSVARRAYQAALRGDDSAFFYVRRFVPLAGGPDEYVVVICRMTDGGARSPFALTEVKLSFDVDEPVLVLKAGDAMPPIRAEIGYNGTGRLRGRWEVVLPGDEPPEARDLLTEGTLPAEERGTQRRYTELGRFNVFLPLGGRTVLRGPDVSRFPTQTEGQYLILLRIEATDDRESDSDLGAVGAGRGIVHSGAVAGFPLPVLHYNVGARSLAPVADAPAPLVPEDGAVVDPEQKVAFAWGPSRNASIYRLEVEDPQSRLVLSALLPHPLTAYRAPSWLAASAAGRPLRWRVVALEAAGSEIAATAWRTLQFADGRE